MKKLLFIIVVALMATACASSTLVDRTENFVEDFIENSDSYSDQELEESVQKMEAFSNEFDEYRDKLSVEERSRFMEAVGKFEGTLLKITFKKAGDMFDDSADYMNGLLDGMLDSTSND